MIRRGVASGLAALTSVIACTGGEQARTSPRPGVAASMPSAASSTKATALASAAPAEEQRLSPPLPDGCYNGVSVKELAPQAAVEAIAARCVQGMSAVLPAVRTMRLQRGQRMNIDFQIDDATRCYRVVAVAPAARDLVVEMSDGKNTIASEDLIAPLALLSQRGPVCVSAAGRYSIVVRVADDDADAAVQVYRAD